MTSNVSPLAAKTDSSCSNRRHKKILTVPELGNGSIGKAAGLIMFNQAGMKPHLVLLWLYP